MRCHSWLPKTVPLVIAKPAQPLAARARVCADLPQRTKRSFRIEIFHARGRGTQIIRTLHLIHLQRRCGPIGSVNDDSSGGSLLAAACAARSRSVQTSLFAVTQSLLSPSGIAGPRPEHCNRDHILTMTFHGFLRPSMHLLCHSRLSQIPAVEEWGPFSSVRLFLLSSR
jgi:hypothetical protein